MLGFKAHYCIAHSTEWIQFSQLGEKIVLILTMDCLDQFAIYSDTWRFDAKRHWGHIFTYINDTAARFTENR